MKELLYTLRKKYYILNEVVNLLNMALKISCRETKDEILSRIIVTMKLNAFFNMGHKVKQPTLTCGFVKNIIISVVGLKE